MHVSKKFLVVPALLVAVAGGAALPVLRRAQADSPTLDIVGAWEVTAQAPYAPHLFTFNADGTMLSANPTDVQVNPSAPHGGTNDSLGMGTWQAVNDQGTRYVEGTFEELNATA